MKKLAIALVVAATGGAGTWYVWPSKNGGNGARVETKRVKVERGDITVSVTATGEIKPLKVVELKSKASGQVVQFKKEPGDPVDEGELIAELDKKTEKRSLVLARSSLLSAEASLELTRLKYSADLKTAESETAASKEEEKQKTAELRRLEKLTGDLVTESELGSARLAARLAEEKAKQADAALTLIRGRKEADEKLAIAEVEKASVSVEDARERLQDTEILSPVKGILLKKLVEEGQIVASGISASTGGTPIAVAADVSQLMVEANVDETDVAKIKKGQPVEISLLSGSTERFKGRVELIPPQGELDSNVIVFKVRILFEGHVFGRVYAGMTASVNIRVSERKGTLLVPSEAVKIEHKKPIVHVPDGEGSRPVQVKTGLDNGVKTEILSGLEENQEVMITHTITPDGKPGGRPRLRW